MRYQQKQTRYQQRSEMCIQAVRKGLFVRERLRITDLLEWQASWNYQIPSHCSPYRLPRCGAGKIRVGQRRLSGKTARPCGSLAVSARCKNINWIADRECKNG